MSISRLLRKHIFANHKVEDLLYIILSYHTSSEITFHKSYKEKEECQTCLRYKGISLISVYRSSFSTIYPPYWNTLPKSHPLRTNSFEDLVRKIFVLTGATKEDFFNENVFSNHLSENLFNCYGEFRGISFCLSNKKNHNGYIGIMVGSQEEFCLDDFYDLFNALLLSVSI